MENPSINVFLQKVASPGAALRWIMATLLWDIGGYVTGLVPRQIMSFLHHNQLEE